MDTEKDELHQETTAMESVANLAPSALLILFHKVTNLHLEKKEIICSLYNVPGSGNANIDTENEDWKKVESYIKSYIYVWIINKDMVSDILFLIKTLTHPGCYIKKNEIKTKCSKNRREFIRRFFNAINDRRFRK
jgi:hypothetical protein